MFHTHVIIILSKQVIECRQTVGLLATISIASFKEIPIKIQHMKILTTLLLQVIHANDMLS